MINLFNNQLISLRAWKLTKRYQELFFGILLKFLIEFVVQLETKKLNPKNFAFSYRALDYCKINNLSFIAVWMNIVYREIELYWVNMVQPNKRKFNYDFESLEYTIQNFSKDNFIFLENKEYKNIKVSKYFFPN